MDSAVLKQLKASQNESVLAASIKHEMATKVAEKPKSEHLKNQAIKGKEKGKNMPVLTEELFQDEDDGRTGSSILKPDDNLLLSEKDNLKVNPLESPKPGPVEKTKEVKAAHGSPERTKVSRKASEELRPKKEMKKRLVSLKPEQASLLKKSKKLWRGTDKLLASFRRLEELEENDVRELLLN